MVQLSVLSSSPLLLFRISFIVYFMFIINIHFGSYPTMTLYWSLFVSFHILVLNNDQSYIMMKEMLVKLVTGHFQLQVCFYSFHHEFFNSVFVIFVKLPQSLEKWLLFSCRTEGAAPMSCAVTIQLLRYFNALMLFLIAALWIVILEFVNGAPDVQAANICSC